MLFFYKSHTPIFSYTGHLKKIYNAVKCAIPTQILKKGVQWKKYLKNKEKFFSERIIYNSYRFKLVW